MRVSMSLWGQCRWEVTCYLPTVVIMPLHVLLGHLGSTPPTLNLYPFPPPPPPSSIQWTADNVNDMYADAVLAVVLQIEANPDDFQGGHNMFPTVPVLCGSVLISSVCAMHLQCQSRRKARKRRMSNSLTGSCTMYDH